MATYAKQRLFTMYVIDSFTHTKQSQPKQATDKHQTINFKYGVQYSQHNVNRLATAHTDPTHNILFLSLHPP